MKVIVIGGGFGGLAAAHHLLRSGAQVSLYEAADELGGQASTFALGGSRLERFYHHLFNTDRDIIGLLNEVGLGKLLMWLPSRNGMYYDGRIYTMTPIDLLLRFKPLSFFDRVRLGFLLLYLQRQRQWEHFEKVTAEDWVRRYGGERILEVVWGPLLRGKFGERSSEVSMAWLWNKIHLRAQSRGKGMQEERLGYVDGSFQVLIDALENSIQQRGGDIYRSAAVERVLIEDGRALGVEAVVGGTSRQDHAGVVVAAVPPSAFLKLAPGLPADYVERLGRVRYQAVQCLNLVLKRSISPIYWLSIADPSMPFVAVIEHTNFISPEAYGGKRFAYLSSYLSPDRPIYHLSQDELLLEYLPHLRQINPHFGPDWIEDVRLFRDLAGQPIITRGYSGQLPPHDTPIRGLYLANTSQIYPEDRGTNYSVRLGLRVAQMVLNQGHRQAG